MYWEISSYYSTNCFFDGSGERVFTFDKILLAELLVLMFVFVESRSSDLPRSSGVVESSKTSLPVPLYSLLNLVTTLTDFYGFPKVTGSLSVLREVRF